MVSYLVDIQWFFGGGKKGLKSTREAGLSFQRSCGGGGGSILTIGGCSRLLTAGGATWVADGNSNLTCDRVHFSDCLWGLGGGVGEKIVDIPGRLEGGVWDLVIEPG